MTDIRPTDWTDYIGQTTMKERIETHIDSALIRGASLDHILLAGPPGCGKTTFAAIVAHQFGRDFFSFVMPVKEKLLVRFLRQNDNAVVLFDEIHRMTPKQQETLLPLIEDGYMQLDNGERVVMNNVTIIGATTEPEKIIPPLWDRFTIKPPFDEYLDDEMAQIVTRMAASCGLDLDDNTANVLGRAAGGVPRNAKSLVFMARDLTVTGAEPDVADILIACRVTEDGLTEEHRRYCAVLADAGGVAGLEILSAHLRMSKPVLVELERLLVKRGMLNYTKQGRELLADGWNVGKE